ncbi:MAG: gfo/Idh/MocA family oxidoreductase [Actinobacteria bacterium HGW-Actinobacteria-11]|uniref:Gfo/Idh/MocA family protein n=1 Tax=unclassified Microbacterium TaxID=2609290 RepID=UPI0006488407|nr:MULTISPECIES: Gfo/Idh/MocA family oxidoreductase [unclassified Microbacterium]PKQ36571.1 MAG: gfo/Idh/MocA family oxidoreductase [Actinobacteria bacterium HGW-Actinobacteria-11]TFB15984.1 Gfo/Idh/MocA family oxidoreductase [Microbacterium sp. 3H14]
MAKKPYGVGIIGAGPGARALHAPTLARLGDTFAVVHVADSGSGAAGRLADSFGARSSTGAESLLGDPEVDVVVICSPPEHHAAQILAALDAGKRSILCEKPIGLTHEDVDAVIDECRARGAALVVGTNHVYDPAWTRAKKHLLAHGGRIDSITVSLALPPNDRYHAVVSEETAASSNAARPAPDWNDPGFASAVVHSLVLGLAVHDLPLIRDLAPRFERIVYARPVPPIGYAIGLIADGIPISLTAVMLPGGADAAWVLRVLTQADEVEVSFPPAFVHAGSAGVEVRALQGGRTEHRREPVDGYVAEWRGLAALLSGEEAVEYDEIRADAHYAVDIADAAAAWIRDGAAS